MRACFLAPAVTPVERLLGADRWLIMRDKWKVRAEPGALLEVAQHGT